MDLLDDIAGAPKPAENTDVTPAATEPTSTENAEATTASTDAPATTEDSGPEYPKLLGTFATMEEAQAAGYTDLVTSKKFADDLSVRNILKTGDASGIVQVQNVYNAQKAKRHPLSVVLVDGTVYLPSAVATTEWDERPERGEGGSSTTSGVLSDEDLARLTFKAQETLTKDKNRLKTLQAKIEKSEKLAEKRNNQAKTRFGDNWQEVVDKAGETAEADKEIPDDAPAAA